MKLRKNVLAGVALLATGVLFGGMMVLRVRMGEPLDGGRSTRRGGGARDGGRGGDFV